MTNEWDETPRTDSEGEEDGAGSADGREPAPSVPDSRAQLQAALVEAEKWMKDQRKMPIWDKIARIPFKLLDKVTPKFIHEKIGSLLDELGSYVQNGGKYLIARRRVTGMLENIARKRDVPEAGPYPLSVMDEAAGRLAGESRNLAAAQGATTGIGGVFTLAADIPAVLGLSLKVIQEIGLCYGYDANDKAERVFAVKVLQFASSDLVGKQSLLDELNLKAGEDGKLPPSVTAMSKIQGWREVVTTYRDSWGWKKLLQAVPIAGIVFGAFANRQTLGDVSEAAHMLYRKRRILQRLDALEPNQG
ncbi:EcsC family protein [Saccharibacillus alkalitolerans]|uniref:EcsC family protein n=1 Tax=Saccharibacillus alkalitolerans TaxID=2705290 RepID=A0ABX0F7V3_9BACL|nr:EcsC family protein [Saccharibacillus alkalitolerans]NGZ76393.1 EcsC family protein [Saccharibacillus alkalitolerans]